MQDSRQTIHKRKWPGVDLFTFMFHHTQRASNKCSLRLIQLHAFQDGLQLGEVLLASESLVTVPKSAVCPFLRELEERPEAATWQAKPWVSALCAAGFAELASCLGAPSKCLLSLDCMLFSVTRI